MDHPGDNALRRPAVALLLSILMFSGCDLFSDNESTDEAVPATYEVVFESTWSAETHPEAFPSDPHFSGLIGGTHDADTTLWEPGAFASEGIVNMAETGSKEPLRSEVSALIEAGRAGSVLSGDGIASSPGSVSLTFEVTPDFPRVSLVSMIAPSPDWFVGVSGLSLREDGEWADHREITLYVHDAGSDDGEDYTAPDQPSVPRQPISRIEEGAFKVDGEVRAVGTFTFTKQ